MHMDISFPLTNLGFSQVTMPKCPCSKKASVYGSQHIHSVLLWPVESNEHNIFIYAKGKQVSLTQVMSYNLLYFIPVLSIPPQQSLGSGHFA